MFLPWDIINALVDVVRVVAALLHRFALKDMPERTNTTVWKRLKSLAMHKPEDMGSTNGQEFLFK